MVWDRFSALDRLSLGVGRCRWLHHPHLPEENYRLGYAQLLLLAAERFLVLALQLWIDLGTTSVEDQANRSPLTVARVPAGSMDGERMVDQAVATPYPTEHLLPQLRTAAPGEPL